MELTEATGGAVAEMLYEIKEVSKINKLYGGWPSGLEGKLETLRISFQKVKSALLLFWQEPSIFNSR